MDRASWKKRIKYLAYIIAVYVLFVFFWFIYKNSSSVSFADTVDFIAIQGEYSINGEKFKPITDIKELYNTKAKTLVIKGNAMSDMPKGKQIYFFAENIEMKFYINDELILSSIYDGTDPWVECDCPGITKDDDIRIELGMASNVMVNVTFKKFLKRMCYTDRFDLVKFMVTRHASALFIVLVIMLTGINMWVNRYYTYDEKDAGYRMSGGLVLVIGAFSCLLDYNYITLMVYNKYLLKYFDVMSQYLTCICLAAYLRRYLVRDIYKKIGTAILYIMQITVIGFLLNRLLAERITTIENIVLWMMAEGTILVAIEIICMFSDAKKAPKEIRYACHSTLLLAVGFILEMIYYLLTGTYFLYVFEGAICVYGLVHHHIISTINTGNFAKAKKAQELENELTQSQIKIMLSQIQPHFLYNALGTIRALTTKEPQKAKDALTYFSKYLRANMDSLNEKGCIPFKKELEHVESYLHIEKLRFGEKLNIEYDINATDFECPPLMLQTMVENAVKHGLLEKAEGGTIKLSTYETANGYEVRIEDDGVGFDMTKPLDDSRSHIGVQNTRERLAGMCGGNLYIGSKCGEGTTISISIPKKAE